MSSVPFGYCSTLRSSPLVLWFLFVNWSFVPSVVASKLAAATGMKFADLALPKVSYCTCRNLSHLFDRMIFMQHMTYFLIMWRAIHPNVTLINLYKNYRITKSMITILKKERNEFVHRSYKAKGKYPDRIHVCRISLWFNFVNISLIKIIGNIHMYKLVLLFWLSHYIAIQIK